VSVIATSPGPEARIFRALSISSSFTPVLREGCSERGASVKSTTSTSRWMGVAIRPRSEELERLARRCLGIASDVLQRDAGQTEAFDLASLEPRRVGETLREKHDLP
jgi:hypothetical protein